VHNHREPQLLAWRFEIGPANLVRDYHLVHRSETGVKQALEPALLTVEK